MNIRSTLALAPEALQTVIDAIPNPVFMLDRAHRLVLINEAFCTMTGFKREAVIGRSPTEFIPTVQREVFWRIDDQVFETGQPNVNEEVVTDATGAPRVMLTSKRLVRLPGPKGDEAFVVAMITDVTAQRETDQRARYLAGHDELTDLPNRSQFNAELSLAVADAAFAGRSLVLFSVDLSGFKAVNNLHGFAVGDLLLRAIAARIRSFAGNRGKAFRLGGDEFCLILKDIHSAEEAEVVAAALLDQLQAPADIAGEVVSVGAAIGVAVFPDDGDTPARLRQQAEAAMQAVKRQHRSAVHHIRRDGDNETRGAAGAWDILAELETAVADGQLTLYYQPVCAARDGTPCGFEALLRWPHPSRGMIAPDRFIPIAEASGLIGRLGDWVLARACRQAAGWDAALRVAVNVSPRQLMAHGFCETVARVLRESGLAPERLELEITETALLGDDEVMMQAFTGLKTLGVGIALDDFGTGWSSLASLRKFGFDRVKVDRGFVSNIEYDIRSVAIVRAVVGLAKALDVQVTAEGIETPGQLNALRAMGCDEVQGYLIGRPAEVPVTPQPEAWLQKP